MERVITSDEAIKIAKKYLKIFEIDYQIEEFQTNSFKSVFVTGLKNGLEIETSSGKGIGTQYLASGLFELLEHYISIHEDFNKVDLIDYPNKVDFIKCFDYPLRELAKINNEKFEFLIFENIKTKEKLLYPAFLTTTEFAEKLDDSKYIRIKQYSTNSGTAIGVSYKEAFVHGFMEILERHAVSMHILENFYLRKTGFYNSVIDPTSLTNNHKEIFDTIHQLTGQSPIIFELTTNTDIPTYMVIAHNEIVNHPFQGSGSSLSSDYALERAL